MELNINVLLSELKFSKDIKIVFLVSIISLFSFSCFFFYLFFFIDSLLRRLILIYIHFYLYSDYHLEEGLREEEEEEEKDAVPISLPIDESWTIDQVRNQS